MAKQKVKKQPQKQHQQRRKSQSSLKKGDLMTTEEVKKVLKSPYKPLVLASLSYVNLTDRELNLLILRYMRGHTQEETAEELCSMIKAYQATGKEVPVAMQAVWDWEHENQVDDVARVRALLEAYKK